MGVKTKRGKTDYRAWSRKYLMPGAFPEPVNGWGIGRKRYCPGCKCLTTKSFYKVLPQKGCYCGECGTLVKEYLPNDYNRLYPLEGKIPYWLWNIFDKYCLYRQRTYKKMGDGA